VFWNFDSDIDPFFSDLQGWFDLARTKAPFFECPSNQHFFPKSSFYLFTQPLDPQLADGFMWVRSTADNSDPLGISNYVGCLGATGGGALRPYTEIWQWRWFRATTQSRRRLGDFLSVLRCV